MRIIGLLLAVMLIPSAGSSAADEPPKLPPKAEAAREKYEAACAKAKAAYEKALAEAVKPYKQQLEAAMKDATRAGDLDGALAIRKQIERLETGATAAAPPKDAVKVGGHYYKVFDGRVSWEEAKANCEAAGGHLVVINSSEENAAVRKMLSNDIVWLGGRRMDGKWQWVDGARWSDDGWMTSSKRDAAEHEFLAWNPRDNGWTGAVLSERFAYVCEWD